jgi:putative glutamine amidotransferase
MKRPLIGVTLDSEPAGGWSALPWYALRQNYAASVARAGGLAMLLPHEPEQAADYLDRIDGLIVTGGAFDVDPALFGAESRHPTVTTKDRRTAVRAGDDLGRARRATCRCSASAAASSCSTSCSAARSSSTSRTRCRMRCRMSSPIRARSPATPSGWSPARRLHADRGVREQQVNSAHHQAATRRRRRRVVDAVAPTG